MKNDEKSVLTLWLEFPLLERAERHREYDSYSLVQRSEIVKCYLFEGKSFRGMDRDVLGMDSAYSRGWQAKGMSS